MPENEKHVVLQKAEPTFLPNEGAELLSKELGITIYPTVAEAMDKSPECWIFLHGDVIRLMYNNHNMEILYNSGHMFTYREFMKDETTRPATPNGMIKYLKS